MNERRETTVAKSTAKTSTTSSAKSGTSKAVTSRSGAVKSSAMLATGRASGRSVSPSAVTSRFPISPRVRAAAARARVAADVKRGVDTPGWIRELAGQ